MVVFMDQLAQQTPPMPGKLPVIGQVNNPNRTSFEIFNPGFFIRNFQPWIFHPKIHIPNVQFLDFPSEIFNPECAFPGFPIRNFKSRICNPKFHPFIPSPEYSTLNFKPKIFNPLSATLNSQKFQSEIIT